VLLKPPWAAKSGKNPAQIVFAARRERRKWRRAAGQARGGSSSGSTVRPANRCPWRLMLTLLGSQKAPGSDAPTTRAALRQPEPHDPDGPEPQQLPLPLHAMKQGHDEL
jgi:hypothetical protein